MKTTKDFVDNAIYPNDYARIEAQAAALRSLAISEMLDSARKGIKAGFSHVFSKLMDMNSKYRQSQALYSMSERQLNDMGINRGDIENILNPERMEKTQKKSSYFLENFLEGMFDRMSKTASMR